MELYLIESYRDAFPELKGRELTDELIRRILKQSGVSCPQILRTPEGKPYIETEEVCFSVSHTADTFALAVDDAPLGLDIQYRRDAKASRIGRKYFTEQEQEMVREGGLDAFFRIWTRKEAYGKYLGTGLLDVLDRVPVYGRSDVSFLEIDFGDGLYGCVCCGRGPGKGR